MMTNDLIIIYFCVFSGLKCVSLEDVGIDLNDELAKIANRAETGEEGLDGKDLEVPYILILPPVVSQVITLILGHHHL